METGDKDREFERKMRRVWIARCTPLLFILTGVMLAPCLGRADFVLVAFGVAVLAMLVAGNFFMLTAACPRCGEPFFRMKCGMWNIWKLKCSNCGLRI